MAEALRAAIGRYAHTAALLDGRIVSPGVTLDFADLPVPSRAFAPMVREQRFDVSEMAIATFLMAKAWGKPLVLLPITLAARFQEAALLCRADGTVQGPGDLAGRRVGVRAYSQTTGMWLRGVLAERHGVAPEAVRWVTFEDAHVAEYRDPPFAERAPKGADMLAMLKAGELDAAIFGNDLPADAALRPVFHDPAAAGEAFRAAHGFVPVNHLVCVTREVAARRAEEVRALVALFAQALAGTTLPFGREALRAPLDLATRWCVEQALMPRSLTPDEIWDGLPAGIG
ncbi:ABC transporter substrate-binding protein [Falsiroseomonas oryziterrae]|uniref:ABC transporter substrate-binding protein n=1 Tax=Falsiroseomonas oryziterrae TaxID=2911368 RepID=UPI001F2711F7|nr:ABC transporter substrate-binding protein [Roseomonas sp. NPKOSM-4]